MSSVKMRVVATALALVPWLTGCGGEPLSDEDLAHEELGTYEQALCSNVGGVNGVLAALAVASANEMRRWLPTRDFQWNSYTGMLELSMHALPRCPNRYCTNVIAMLDLQRPAAHGKVTFSGDVTLDSTLLRKTLKNYWNSQVACNAAGNCPVDYHDLTYNHKKDGPCGVRYFYNAFEMGTKKPLDAAQANRFSNQLLFLGHPQNPFLDFKVEDGRASVDPTYGLTEKNSASAGSCEAACTRFSASNIVGKCCSCNGKNKKYARSTFSGHIYLCK